jgi:hypothetical protein
MPFFGEFRAISAIPEGFAPKNGFPISPPRARPEGWIYLSGTAHAAGR